MRRGEGLDMDEVGERWVLWSDFLQIETPSSREEGKAYKTQESCERKNYSTQNVLSGCYKSN